MVEKTVVVRDCMSRKVVSFDVSDDVGDIVAVLLEHKITGAPVLNADKQVIGFTDEAMNALRGYQFDAAWGDELAKWVHGEACFDNLQFSLRLGEQPRALFTTTPRPIPLLKRLLVNLKASWKAVALIYLRRLSRPWHNRLA